jgi:hypothetical protein
VTCCGTVLVENLLTVITDWQYFTALVAALRKVRNIFLAILFKELLSLKRKALSLL